MSNTKTYTFTEEQLRVVIEDAVDLRDHEVAMNPLLGKPVRTPAVFADEYAKTLGDTFNKNEKEDVWARRAKDDAELSDDQDEDARFAARVAEEVKEAEDKEEPNVEDEEDEEDEPKGYISSRPVDKLQFNIDTLKLGNLPGCYKMVKEEGGFFKALSDMWNAGDWFENEPLMEEDDTTPSSFLDDMHCCSDTFWVNPKYANSKMSDLGEIGCREVAMDGTTAISIVVYYKKDDGTVIAYDINAC